MSLPTQLKEASFSNTKLPTILVPNENVLVKTKT
jgi:hypothetical protein